MKPIRMYIKPTCPYCVNARRLLSELDLPFEETDVTNNPELRQKISAEQGGYPTVPMIFIGDEFIGGYSDMETLHRNGELLPKARAS